MIDALTMFDRWNLRTALVIHAIFRPGLQPAGWREGEHMIQSIDPAEGIRLLREGCCKGLTVDQQRILAARVVSDSARTAAQLMYLSERAFRDRLARVEDIVLVPLGLPRDSALAGVWFVLHSECCTKEAWALAEMSAIFPAAKT
jgi:hypothetical protein